MFYHLVVNSGIPWCRFVVTEIARFMGLNEQEVSRGGSRTAATSKMELFVIIVNGWKPPLVIKYLTDKLEIIVKSCF